MEDQSYVKVLQYRRRNSIVSFETLYFILSLVIIVGSMIILNRTIRDPNASTAIFLLNIFYLMFFIFIFVDSFMGFGILFEQRNTISAYSILATMIITLIFVLLDLFNFIYQNENGELITSELFILLLFIDFMITYYLHQGNPTKKDKSLTEKFEEIKTNLSKKRASELGVENAIAKAIRWLEFSQNKDGLWAKERPLYETSEILNTLYRLPGGLQHKWNVVFDGIEEERNVEQIFYSVLDVANSSLFEPTYDHFFNRKVVGEINLEVQKYTVPREITGSDGSPLTGAELKAEREKIAIKKFREWLSITDDGYFDLKRKVERLSAWDFVTELETQIKEGKLDKPYILSLVQFAILRHEFDLAQVILDIISETFSIILSRSVSRFSVRSEQTEIPDWVVSMMYNTLVECLYLEQLVLKVKNEMLGTKEGDDMSVGKMASPDIPSFGESPSVPGLPNVPDMQDVQSPSIPDLSGASLGIPELTPSVPRDDSANQDSLTVSARLSHIRNYLEDKQEIDGGWEGSLFSTAESLMTLLHRESTEHNAVKLALNFLLANQKNNGSWSDDFVISARIIRTLMYAQSKMLVVNI